MAVVAQYALRGSDYGILGIAFPAVPVLNPPFPPFVPQGRVIVCSDADHFSGYADKEVIQITENSPIELDTRKGFLQFLASIGVKATKGQVDALMVIDEADFWQQSKMAVVLKVFPMVPTESSAAKGAVYRLYEALFENFDTAARECIELRATMSSPQIFSALMSMTMKARTAHRRGDLSSLYRDLLIKNHRHEAIFKRALLNHLEMERRRRPRDELSKDLNLLSFIAECSSPP